MKIEVHLYATLSRYLPGGTGPRSARVELPEEAKISDLMNRLGIPASAVKLIFKNGLHADPEDALLENDRVGLFPPVGGG